MENNLYEEEQVKISPQDASFGEGGITVTLAVEKKFTGQNGLVTIPPAVLISGGGKKPLRIENRQAGELLRKVFSSKQYREFSSSLKEILPASALE